MNSKTKISWTDTTWNPVVGCTKVSAGCENCYAEALVRRFRKEPFSLVVVHDERLADAHKFRQIWTGKRYRPRMVFVNSMSDLFHPDVPVFSMRDVYDAMERAQPFDVVFQVLTKRPALMSQFLRQRWGDRGFGPTNIWHGVSVENGEPEVVKRLDILRGIKRRYPGLVAFVSVEPLISAPDGHDYSEIDWVIVGGESPQRGKCRPMREEWVRDAIARARAAGAAVWFKQWGAPANNPVVRAIAEETGLPYRAALALAVERGLEIPNEKGGAMIDGAAIRELPRRYYELCLADGPDGL